MKVFTSNDFKGHWPVPTAAVVVAIDEAEARRMLNERLSLEEIPQKEPSFTLQQVNCRETAVLLLSCGEY